VTYEDVSVILWLHSRRQYCWGVALSHVSLLILSPLLILMNRDRPTRHIRSARERPLGAGQLDADDAKQKPQPAADDVAHQLEVLTPATLTA
jgi:hypothetical protein